MNTIPPREDFTNQELQAIFAKAESHAVRSIGEFTDQVLELIERPHEVRGIKLPWGKTHGLVRLRPKEASIWAGINGHRKTTLLNQVALWATREVPVGIASLEMPVEGLVKSMVTQAAGATSPTREFTTKLVQRLHRQMWFYDRIGSIPPIEALGAIHALSMAGCKLVVLDSLAMCRVTDDMERERLFMAELTSLAKALDIHIAVVHHVRKPQSGGDEFVPSRFDVKGSGAIVDIVQNLFICWANKARAEAERKVSLGYTLTDREQECLDKQPDQKLIVAKQRFAEFEGPISLWHHPSRQFVGDASGKPMHLFEHL